MKLIDLKSCSSLWDEQSECQTENTLIRWHVYKDQIDFDDASDDSSIPDAISLLFDDNGWMFRV